MARDRTFGALAVTTTSYIIPLGRGTANSAHSHSGNLALTRYLSGYNLAETAGAAAVVKIRDSIALPGPITSAADGAAGNATAGLHMFQITGVTVNGETTYGRNAGDRLEFTTAGTVIVNLTGVPTFPINNDGLHATNGTPVIGRRLYITKAGAPATTVQPTRAQWFLYSLDLSTTLAAGMNSLCLPSASITVAATTNFKSTNGNILVTTADGVQAVAYTSVDATHFLGCTGGSGYMSTGGAVTQPHIGDNTVTTFAFNLADGSLAATNPPLADTAGLEVKRMRLAANESIDMSLGNAVEAINDGGFAVEVNSGTVDFTLVGG